jgi:hypothetical protein
MVSSRPSSTGEAHPRSTSLEQRGEQCAAVQRRLKEEAAERRRQAAASGIARPATGLSQRSRPGKRP